MEYSEEQFKSAIEWCRGNKLSESGSEKFSNLMGKTPFEWALMIASQEENQMNIDKVETQTEHQEEMSAFSGEAEWGGEGLPPVGVECEFEYPEGRWNKGFYHGLTASAGVEMHILEFEGGCIETFGGLTKFRKPETPQQREDRERLEAAYDLYCYAIDKETLFDSFCNFGPLKDIYLRIVDKTNYRNGVK
ncbi:hypothetical protein NVP1100O_24 [Vibrio phage 1.100.O._10N.261.45.C3]|nr:hypothetical protein NVP1100O_24 [Vibrio phage 1.100.O._10N.261.45.C3]